MKHIELFDLIAPAYAWFFSYQRKGYRQSLDVLFKQGLNGSTALDVGCGTGALSTELSSYLLVKAVDGSSKMIKEAHRLNPQLDLVWIDVSHGLPFRDNEFDYVFSSFVLHGLSSSQRLALLKEMKRVSLKSVIILDYHKGRHPFISLVEWIEHGDYFHFMDHFDEEILDVFDHKEILKINKHTAFYILN
jgi:ubiquinone/menaquinone biosynthesis C-methylase UbiE